MRKNENFEIMHEIQMTYKLLDDERELVEKYESELKAAPPRWIVDLYISLHIKFGDNEFTADEARVATGHKGIMSMLHALRRHGLLKTRRVKEDLRCARYRLVV